VSGTGSRHIASEGPETKADSYSFRRAYEAGAFQQLSLLRDRDFIKQAKERGVRLSVEVLEELDEIGALRPVAFATEHVVMSLLPRTDLVFRDETAFLPWENHAIEQGFGSSKPEAFYSHWHLLYTHDAVEHGIARVGTDWLLDDERVRPVHESFRGWYGHQDELRRNLDDDWRRTVLVLARLQNRYFPHIRGTLTKLTTTSVYDPDVGEFVDAYSRTVGEFDMQAVLNELDANADELEKIHTRLAVHGQRVDPLRKFYLMFRMAPHKQRARLLNDARRAHDFYDAADMVRRAYHDLTGELLRDAEEIFDAGDGSWRERLLGHERRVGFTTEDLAAVLKSHNLYPHTVHIAVEGKTEELLLRGLIGASGGPPENLGITFSNIEGAGGARLHAHVLRAAKRYARIPVLVADREADMEREVEVMKRDGLLEDDTVFLWETSLEEANFSDAELVAMAERIAQRQGHPVELDSVELRLSYQRGRDRAGRDGPGLGEVLLRLVRQQTGGAVAITKPDLAAEMMALLLEEMSREKDEQELLAKRPVLKIVFGVLRIV
jgi:hypothetical protein